MRVDDFAPMAPEDADAVCNLWARCGLTRPWNDPVGDIALACRSENADILVLKNDAAISAAVMVGHDGHRGAVYYLAVDADHQSKGIGRAAMAAAENWCRERGLRKLNIMVRADNDKVAGFYQAL